MVLTNYHYVPFYSFVYKRENPRGMTSLICKDGAIIIHDEISHLFPFHPLAFIVYDHVNLIFLPLGRGGLMELLRLSP